MRVIKVIAQTNGEGRILVVDMAVLQEGENIEEDAWDTVTNALRLKGSFGSISGNGDLILDIGCLDINTLG